MFKSIFKRYIAYTTVLMAFSFALLMLMISTMLTSYSTDTRTALMSDTADNIVRALDSHYEYTGNNDLSASLSNNILSLAETADADVYITDGDGVLLLTNDETRAAGIDFLRAETIDKIALNPNVYKVGRLDDVFARTRVNYCRAIQRGGVITCTVVVSSVSVRDRSLSQPMIRTILVTSLWVLMASALTAYILFQRITDPLKKLSDAARAFAKGDFKQRVFVRGNDELAELAGAFNNMATVLEKNEEMRNSFLGSVSHDLRTPMTVIRGFIDGIRDGTIPPEKQDYYLGIISSEVSRLSRLVSSLLEISRMQSGEKKLTLSHFNVSEKARQVLLTFEKKIDEKKLEVEFNCEEEITVHADTDAVHQVLYNLIDNAVKFVNVGGTLSITVERRQKKAHIVIRNTGEGIPEEEIPHVFDRFYKSDRSRGLDKTGTGLGLFIVKTNINMHNEEIVLRSKQGEYTEFSFCLPT